MSEAERALPPRTAVCYDDLMLDVAPAVDPMEEARLAAKKRAERFGTEYKEPNKNVVLSRTDLAKMRSKRDGFATGIDLYSEEEKAKREARAAKFGATLLALTPEAAEAALQAKQEQEEKQAAIQKRIDRFGKVEAAAPKAGAQTMELDLLEERQDAARDAEPRMEAVVLYGVDTMSTKECMQYFGEYGPSFVEWINDSSLVVVFEDEFTTRRIIHGMGTPLTNDAPRPDTVPVELGQLFCWHQGPSFTKAGVKLDLQFRIATTADVKPRGRTKSRFLWKKDKEAAAKVVTKKASVAPSNLGGDKKQKRKRVRDEPMAEAADQVVEAHEAAPTTIQDDQPAAAEQGDLRSRLKPHAEQTLELRERLKLQLTENLRGVLDEEGLVPDFGGDSEEEDYEMSPQPKRSKASELVVDAVLADVVTTAVAQ